MSRISIIWSLLFFGSLATAQQVDTLQRVELESVSIVAPRNTYKKEESQTVSKLSLKDIENPQSYNAISKEVLKDQLVTNFNDALKNATGVTRLWESTGRGGDGAEYYTMRGFAVQPTFINGMANINNGALDPANVETIEVIKGPSGTLFGGNLISYGGLINILTKQPTTKLGGSIGYVTGSNSLNRITADVNTPINENTYVRINTAFHTENSFQDAGYNKSFFIAPALKFIASEKLSFLVNTELNFREGAYAPMVFLNRYAPLSFDKLDVFEKNYQTSYTNNLLSIKNPTYGIQAQAKYQFNNHWSSQTLVASSNTKTDGYYHYLWDASNGDEFTRFISKRNGATTTQNIQQNFIGDFTLGKIRNRLLIGMDYLHKIIQNNSTGWVSNGTVSLNNQDDSGVLTSQGVDALLEESQEGVSNAKTEIVSVYFSDVVNLTPALSLMLSLRVDNFSGKASYWASDASKIQNQTTYSPKLGIVYQPIKDKLSLFGNFMNGFINLDPAEVADFDGSNPRIQLFDPEQANQWEIGAKGNIYKDKIAMTASYYNIKVSNKLMTDPNNPNNQIQGGEVESKGFELSVVTSPIEGLSIVTGFSKNHSEVTKDTKDAGYLGLRPEEAGPDQLFNFWANYRIHSGTFRNWGIGVGSNYASEHKTLNRSNIGTFTLPAYAVFNASLSYDAAQYSINLKINNLSNQKVYTGWSTVTPQVLRNISLGLNYRF